MSYDGLSGITYDQLMKSAHEGEAQTLHTLLDDETVLKCLHSQEEEWSQALKTCISFNHLDCVKIILEHPSMQSLLPVFQVSELWGHVTRKDMAEYLLSKSVPLAPHTWVAQSSTNTIRLMLPFGSDFPIAESMVKSNRFMELNVLIDDFSPISQQHISSHARTRRVLGRYHLFPNLQRVREKWAMMKAVGAQSVQGAPKKM